ncbi:MULTISPECIES: ABC transporter permease [Lysinibacillus]|uniref:ABC transporter permease n=1 Tax=Lysinibacillus sphaericus TaxID=1421 RepID=A0A544ULM4_LYSSH|nr:ABC transporter permease [Lysinibacillus sp. SDF0037]TQR34372.1 ABC transporter permease [Lysinibacillus sp. SDF0037]
MEVFNVFKVNFKREWIHMKRYLPNTISELIIFYIVFLGFFLGISLIGDPESHDYNIQMVIMNYIFWYLVLSLTQGIGLEISGEAGRGTLEQLTITPYKLWFIFMTRMVSVVIISMVSISILLLLAMLTAKQRLNLDLLSITPILLITLLGVLGVGYMVSSITIILKESGHIIQIFQFVIMGMTFIPLTTVPFLKFAPFMYGLQLIREITINDLSISSLNVGNFLFLIINSTIYFTIGIYVFNKAEKVAKQKALLGHY